MMKRRAHNLGPTSLRRRLLVFQVAALGVIIFVFYQAIREHSFDPFLELGLDNEEIRQTATDFANHPVAAPYKDRFGEVGRRARNISQWISISDRMRTGKKKNDLLEATEL